MKIKDAIFDAIKGFLMGTAILIPGVSAGTIALITKVYDKLITNIANLTKKFWTSFKALIPIGIGVALAIVAMWYPLKLATEHILFAIVCLFAGSMIGSMPDIASNLKGEPLKKRYFIYLILAILIGMTFGILSYKCDVNLDAWFKPIQWPVYLVIIPVGFLAAAGIVVPGISGSMFLLSIGFYTQILGMFSNNNIGPAIGVLACMAVGVILGMVFFSWLMKRLLGQAKNATYVWIIGLVAGGVFSLFYNHDMIAYYNKGLVWWEILLAVILFIGGLVGSYILTAYQKKHAA